MSTPTDGYTAQSATVRVDASFSGGSAVLEIPVTWSYYNSADHNIEAAKAAGYAAAAKFVDLYGGTASIGISYQGSRFDALPYPPA